MSPEYKLPDEKLNEVRNFLIKQRSFRRVAIASSYKVEIFVAELDGEPIVILNNGILKRPKDRTIRMSREVADMFSEAGIHLSL
ncbi:hypothetical protein A3A49_00235 [Candidatus Curtissbacteria bacterium RIFCSPLOWO2_01_FULL_38_11b]|uniref:Uncharacterized protein n=1 Tax=Candidatus Curtissbacteria bacterium RIFCSPLOWO2_01_FULL_38_11b TaxID=1797725 RepID=A0A1F5GZW0_9BACT|nr:MAG: hypothetical protein A3A49_00235 [Candidatus Curtissbacteria bacterium RIFCSPLOWO2_01_FULL_38_11b]